MGVLSYCRLLCISAQIASMKLHYNVSISIWLPLFDATKRFSRLCDHYWPLNWLIIHCDFCASVSICSAHRQSSSEEQRYLLRMQRSTRVSICSLKIRWWQKREWRVIYWCCMKGFNFHVKVLHRTEQSQGRLSIFLHGGWKVIVWLLQSHQECCRYN